MTSPLVSDATSLTASCPRPEATRLAGHRLRAIEWVFSFGGAMSDRRQPVAGLGIDQGLPSLKVKSINGGMRRSNSSRGHRRKSGQRP